MKKPQILWISWLILVILWNFGFPEVDHIWDVIIAVILSFLSILVKKYWK